MVAAILRWPEIARPSLMSKFCESATDNAGRLKSNDHSHGVGQIARSPKKANRAGEVQFPARSTIINREETSRKGVRWFLRHLTLSVYHSFLLS